MSTDEAETLTDAARFAAAITTTTANCITVGGVGAVTYSGYTWPVIAETGDRRRWPDCGIGLTVSIEWLDDDLRQTVLQAYVPEISAYMDNGGIYVTRAWDYGDAAANNELFWAWLNTFDAAIDEQDRRRGREPRPVQRER